MIYKLHYAVSGNGRPLLLLHGLAGSSRYWEAMMPGLDKRFKVIRVDLLGFGKSPRPAQAAYSIEDQLDSLLAVLDELKLTDKMVVVGHSMGALIATALALRWPKRISQLILLSPPVYMNPIEARKILRTTGRLGGAMRYGPVARTTCWLVCQHSRPVAQRTFGRFVRKVPRPIVEDFFEHTWRSYSRSRNQIVEQQSSFLDWSKLTVPTTILYGRQDKLLVPAHYEQLHQQNARISFEAYDGGHHLLLSQPALLDIIS